MGCAPKSDVHAKITLKQADPESGCNFSVRIDFLQPLMPVIFLEFLLCTLLSSLLLSFVRDLLYIIFCVRGILFDHGWDLVSKHGRVGITKVVVCTQGVETLQ